MFSKPANKVMGLVLRVVAYEVYLFEGTSRSSLSYRPQADCIRLLNSSQICPPYP